MFSKLGKIAAFVAVAALGMVSLIGDVSAASLNTHAAVFHTYDSASAGNIAYSPLGVYTVVHQNIEVIGPVVRSPTNASDQSFYIDGSNGPGATTSFVLQAYDYLGNLQSSVAFDASAPASNGANYDLYQTLSPIDPYSYVSLYALLPANNRGTLRGITAIQP
jgi:hypothetical protein